MNEKPCPMCMNGAHCIITGNPCFNTRKSLCDALKKAYERGYRTRIHTERYDDCHIWEPGDKLDTISDKCEVLIKATDIKALVTRLTKDPPICEDQGRFEAICAHYGIGLSDRYFLQDAIYALDERDSANELPTQSREIAQTAVALKIDAPVQIGHVRFGPGCTIYKCPCCGTFLTPTHKYCLECGQAVRFPALGKGE